MSPADFLVDRLGNNPRSILFAGLRWLTLAGKGELLGGNSALGRFMEADVVLASRSVRLQANANLQTKVVFDEAVDTVKAHERRRRAAQSRKNGLRALTLSLSHSERRVY